MHKNCQGTDAILFMLEHASSDFDGHLMAEKSVTSRFLC